MFLHEITKITISRIQPKFNRHQIPDIEVVEPQPARLGDRRFRPIFETNVASGGQFNVGGGGTYLRDCCNCLPSARDAAF